MQRRKYIPQYHTYKYHISPLSFYDCFLLHSAINNISEYYLGQLDYGEYMDKGDGLGYDEIAGYDYGYNEALSGIFTSIGTFFGKVGGTVGSIASKTFQFSKKYAVRGWDFTKKWAGKGWKFAKGLPTIGKKAWDWTGKGISKGWQYTKKAGTGIYKWKGWQTIGGATLKFTKAVIVGGLRVGAWFINAFGEAVYVDNQGNITTPPAGERPPQQVDAPYQPYPEEAQYPPSPAQTGWNPYTDTWYGEEEKYLPVDLQSGWILDPETGEPVREATAEEIAVEQERQKKKKGILGYLLAGGTIALLLL